MEQHLIRMTIHHRVEPDANAVVRACVDAQNMKTRLCLMGPKGSMRYLQGPQVAQMANPQQYLTAAQGGFLYVEVEQPVFAFAPALDPTSGLPVLLDGYEDAFAKRSYEGRAADPPAAPAQVAMEMPAATDPAQG